MSANEKMPIRINFRTDTFKYVYDTWLNSLQQCEISESELCLILSNVTKLDYDNPIEVTDVISDNNGVITFKEKDCLCLKCSPIKFPNFRFNVCSICGNKRCPHASDHKYKCTNSNEPNQLGSVYQEQPKQVEEIEAVDMLLNTFGQYCTLNGIKLTDSNKVGQAVIEFKKSDIYQIFKNQK